MPERATTTRIPFAAKECKRRKGLNRERRETAERGFNAKTQRGEAGTKERGIYAASPHGHLETLAFAETKPYRTEKRRERRAPKNLRQYERFGRIAVRRRKEF
jgi:hypothetical protein